MTQKANSLFKKQRQGLVGWEVRLTKHKLNFSFVVSPSIYVFSPHCIVDNPAFKQGSSIGRLQAFF